MKRAKATIAVKLPKPRNPVHAILASKRGGAHRKTEKASRSEAKKQIKKILGAGGNAGSFFLAPPCLFPHVRGAFSLALTKTAKNPFEHAK